MKSMFETGTLNDILQRIDKLQPTAQRQWGKMDVAQMLAHCSAALETATGERVLPRVFIGRLLGPIIKPVFLGEKPFARNAPTDKHFIVSDARNFNTEKNRLLKLAKRFGEGGEAKCTTHPHSFFGRFTPQEWSIAMYKHLDHHLRQFGA
jgi:hypothetical protein